MFRLVGYFLLALDKICFKFIPHIFSVFKARFFLLLQEIFAATHKYAIWFFVGNFVVFIGQQLTNTWHKLFPNTTPPRVMDFILKNEKDFQNQLWRITQLKVYKYIFNKYLTDFFFNSWGNWTDRALITILFSQYKFFITGRFRVNYRLNFFKTGFYALFTTTNSLNTFSDILASFLVGWKFIFNFFSKWILPLIVITLFVFYSMYTQQLPFARIMFVWLSVFSVVYLLMSGFVFFYKKYQYGKFTSVIQRFWKRSLILFWLIEGTLLLVFFYLTLNSTWYLFNVSDQSQLFRGFFFSWRLFLIKIIPNVLLILITYIILINNKWQTFSKIVGLLMVVTTLVIYITWLEFHQYFHLINYFHGKTWFFSKECFEWVIDQDLRKTLSSKNLVNIMLILKFWHVLFIAGMWIFLVLRALESTRLRYPLVAGNLLNFIMLYVLAWVTMYPWFRFFSRKYFSYTYSWFYQNNRNLGWRMFFSDFQIFFLSLSDMFFLIKNYFNLPTHSSSFFYFFKPSNNVNGFVDFNKRHSSEQLLADIFHTSGVNEPAHLFFKEFFKNLANMTLDIFEKINDGFIKFLSYWGVYEESDSDVISLTTLTIIPIKCPIAWNLVILRAFRLPHKVYIQGCFEIRSYLWMDYDENGIFKGQRCPTTTFTERIEYSEATIFTRRKIYYIHILNDIILYLFNPYH